MMLRATVLLFVWLCLSPAAKAESADSPVKLTQEAIAEFYARSTLIYRWPYDEYLGYLDAIFTPDARYTDLTHYTDTTETVPPATNVYDKAKILEMAKDIYDSMEQGSVTNHVKGAYIAADGLSANAVVKMEVMGIHTPGSDPYFSSTGVCEDHLVTGGKYGIMIERSKCTMTMRHMKEIPTPQALEALKDSPPKSTPWQPPAKP